jgi:hypothetical protein
MREGKGHNKEEEGKTEKGKRSCKDRVNAGNRRM